MAQRTIFSQSWFTGSIFDGLVRTLFGTAAARRGAEDAFFQRLIIHLLDSQKAGELRHADILSFYGFCQRHLTRSSAQILQDLWVLFMTGEKHGGFFVEFGACDGVLLSNTKLLESDYGWSGILAEPNQLWHAALAENRKADISHLCVHAASGKRVAFFSTDAMPELSRVANIVPDDVHERNGNRAAVSPIEVDTISLKDLLDDRSAPAVIDYLSIDTEGSEQSILEAFDFGAYSFRLLTVEHAGETAKREAIRALLTAHGYRRWHPGLTRWDDWYVGPDFQPAISDRPQAGTNSVGQSTGPFCHRRDRAR